VTGIALNPVADLGDLNAGVCNQSGEVWYVSVYDPIGGSLDASGHPIRTRIFAFGANSNASMGSASLSYLSIKQIFRSHLANFAGVAVDDDGSLYFQLADPDNLSGAAIFKMTELPRSICGGMDRVNRMIPEGLLDTPLELDTPTPIEGGGIRL